MKEEINSHLNRISLSDGTVFYCNDKLLEDIHKEILQEIEIIKLKNETT